MTEQKVDALHQYFLDGGSDKAADVKAFLEVDDSETVSDIIDALKAKYPDAPYLQEKKKGKKAVAEDSPKPKPETTIIVLLDPETGIGEELEITNTKGSKIYAQRKVPTEIVTIKIAGKDVEVDLIRLRKMKATEQLHGVPVNQLIMLADIAKG